MRLVKKYWRLILGGSFLYSGLSSVLEEGVWAGYAVLVLGCYFILWHAVSLLVNIYKCKKQ